MDYLQYQSNWFLAKQKLASYQEEYLNVLYPRIAGIFNARDILNGRIDKQSLFCKKNGICQECFSEQFYDASSEEFYCSVCSS